MGRLPPQPIPYQGSKRRLAPQILAHFPPGVRTLHEPFCGSAAVSVAAAAAGRAERFVLGDRLAPLVGIWEAIVEEPQALCAAYAELWNAQEGRERAFYDEVREAFNQRPDPARLLFLLCRCVKGAVRFNQAGAFNQAPDNRRRGVHPDTLAARVQQVHRLLAGRTRALVADYAVLLRQADADDLVYLDPPYQGVSGGRDPRYVEGLDFERFVDELARANDRGVSYLLSFDGCCGDRRYGRALPDTLDLKRVDLPAGTSSQATLQGRRQQTVEALYLSPALRARAVKSAPVRTAAG